MKCAKNKDEDIERYTKDTNAFRLLKKLPICCNNNLKGKFFIFKFRLIKEKRKSKNKDSCTVIQHNGCLFFLRFKLMKITFWDWVVWEVMMTGTCVVDFRLTDCCRCPPTNIQWHFIDKFSGREEKRKKKTLIQSSIKKGERGVKQQVVLLRKKEFK